jgi:hypothetical protein
MVLNFSSCTCFTEDSTLQQKDTTSAISSKTTAVSAVAMGSQQMHAAAGTGSDAASNHSQKQTTDQS